MHFHFLNNWLIRIFPTFLTTLHRLHRVFFLYWSNFLNRGNLRFSLLILWRKRLQCCFILFIRAKFHFIRALLHLEHFFSALLIHLLIYILVIVSSNGLSRKRLVDGSILMRWSLGRPSLRPRQHIDLTHIRIDDADIMIRCRIVIIVHFGAIDIILVPSLLSQLDNLSINLLEHVRFNRD